MAFQIQKNISNLFSLESAFDPAAPKGTLLILIDGNLSSENKKVLENFLKFNDEVKLLTPKKDKFPAELEETVLSEIASLGKEEYSLIVTGNFAPVIVRSYNIFRKAKSVVFINPSFRKDIATLMSSFETPCLVVTATPGNLDHDPDAVKYHDLISGSRIQYVRGVEGNPLFVKFTQSFNSIQRFLTDV